MPTLSIERRELQPQPALIMRCRTPRSELQAAIGNSLGGVFGHCMKVGLPLEGRPFTRYLSTGPGLWEIECGKPLAAPAPGEGAIEAAKLPGGAILVAMHGGPTVTPLPPAITSLDFAAQLTLPRPPVRRTCCGRS